MSFRARVVVASLRFAHFRAVVGVWAQPLQRVSELDGAVGDGHTERARGYCPAPPVRSAALGPDAAAV